MSIGIDYHLGVLSNRMNAELFTTFTYTAYARAYANEREGNKIAEIQNTNSNEYTDVLIDTSVAGISFMIVDDEIEPLSQLDFIAKVDIYFAVNLKVLYSSVLERDAHEYLHRDVGEVLNDSEFDITKIVTGREAFKDFDYIKEGDNLEPFYLVKFETEITYELKENIKC